MSGPYETEQQARHDTIPQAVHELWERRFTSPVGETVAEVVLGALRDACTRAGVELGAYGTYVLACLARYAEPETAQVIADLIDRAYAAGHESASTARNA